MGTSHRHKPGVVGEPNWSKASSAMTGIVNNEEKSETLENNPPSNVSQKQIERREKRYSKAIERGYRQTIRNLVRAAGGREKVSSGSSRAFGHAGLSVATAFARTFAELGSNGLSNWLRVRGFGEYLDKSCSEIPIYRGGWHGRNHSESGFGVCTGEIGDKIETDASNFDEVMQATISSSEMKEMIDEYFGMYIFVHLSQNFQEKLAHNKGTEITATTMEDVKNLILDGVRHGFNGHFSPTIDWAGDEGDNFMQFEFKRIIFILTGNED